MDGFNSFVPRKNLHPSGHLLRLDRLDNIIGERTIKFIKADIEGFEFKMFLGARQIMLQTRPIVIFESALAPDLAKLGYGREDFFGYFKSINYRVIDLFGEPLNHHYFEHLNGWYYFAVPQGIIQTLSHRFMLLHEKINAKCD